MEKLRLLTLLVAVFQLSDAGFTKIGCDAGWISKWNNCYLVVNIRSLTWSEAYGECIKYDANLFYVDNSNELPNFQSLVANFPSLAYWTSLNDLVNQNVKAPGDGVWKWGPAAYVNTSALTWSKSPGNDGKVLCGGVNILGSMYDADCNSKQGYICNIDNGKTQGKTCPNGWFPTATDCYYISNTSDPTQLVTWQTAKQDCTILNAAAHLVTIDDPNDQIFIQSTLLYVSKNAYLYWTGLQGNGQAGGWKWFNGATFNQQLLSWATEPDNVGGVEDCAVIRYNGKFSDRGCYYKQNYICKKPPTFAQTSFNVGCGSWRRANQKCYLFHKSDQLTWSDAKRQCQGMNGDLANVKDIDTQAWMTIQLQDPDLGQYQYWTALNDRATEGQYKWGDGSPLNTKTINWNNEPNNWKGNEDCAVILPNGQYNDISCYWTAAPLCELDNVQTCPSVGGTWVSMSADTGGGLNCYLFGSYKNSSALMTNLEASDYCTNTMQIRLPSGKNLVPKLLSVDTTTERTFIKKQLLKYTDNPNGYWTSLNDGQTEGFWQWGTNTNTDTSLVEWHTEPDASTPDTDCVLIGYRGYYKTMKCGFKLQYICERMAFGSSGAGMPVTNIYTSAILLVLPVIVRLLHL